MARQRAYQEDRRLDRLSRTPSVRGAIGASFDTWDGLVARVRPDRRGVVIDLCLIVTFLISSIDRLLVAVSAGTAFIDLRIYREAAAAVLAGDDPWTRSVAGFTFAGPPPSLLAYLPAAVLPEGIAVIGYLAITVLASIALLRRLRVPLWWLAFPPLFESILVINANAVVIALLVMGGRSIVLAPVLKVYALVPMVIRGRWAEAVIGGVLVVIAGGPLWIPFIASLPAINQALVEQAFGGLSAWGTWLMVPVALALVVVGRERAAWLAVPALWPATQLHYSVLALPVAVASPVVAFLLSFAVWPLPALAAIACAAQVLLARLRRWVEPGGDPGPSTAPT